MHPKFPFLASLLFAIIFLIAHVASTNSSFFLGGYGTGINTETYSRIFYGDGTAYVGSGTPSNVSNIVEVNFTTTSTSDFESPFMVVPVNGSITFPEPLYLALNSSSEYAPVVFIPEDGETDGLTITGFGFYGSYLFWTPDGSELEGGWWAVPTSDDHVWIVEFNPDAENKSGAVALVVKQETS